jgi:ribonuclease HI
MNTSEYLNPRKDPREGSLFDLDGDRPLYVVTFDGGCRPKNPGNKYGSWCVVLQHGDADSWKREVVRASRVELGHGTNNEAEFEALIHALHAMHMDAAANGVEGYRVRMLTDSVIVRNRIEGRTRRSIGEAGLRMAVLTKQCHDYLRDKRCVGYRIEWRGRENNVKEFGH